MSSEASRVGHARTLSGNISVLTLVRAVFVHYTAITSVKGGPNGFKSLAEVRSMSSHGIAAGLLAR